MTLPQIESTAIIVAMLGLFIWGRLRYDVVGALALVAATLLGVVPAEHAFSGFASPVVVLIASVLVVGHAIAVSGVVEALVRPILRRLRSTTLQVGTLTACVTLLSAVMKNVGTLGIFMPIGIQAAERAGRPPSRYLMPLSFGSLVGGTMTLIGTSPNLLISTVRREVQGKPFDFFDFLPVGLPLSVITVVFLAFGWRLLPGRRRRARRPADRGTYTTEVLVPPGSASVGRRVEELESQSEGEVGIAVVIREGGRSDIPGADWVLQAGDTLLLHGDPAKLDPFLLRSGLALTQSKELALPDEEPEPEPELETVEAVVGEGSPLVGGTAGSLGLRRNYQVNLLAVKREGERVLSRLTDLGLRFGDVVVLQGRRAALPGAMERLGLLPLAERPLNLGRRRPRLLAAGVLVAAMGFTASGLLRPEVAFFTAALALVLVGAVTAREAYDAIEWPIIVMLGCLIPVGESLRETGAADLIAHWLAGAAQGLPGWAAVGLVLVVSMAVTPFMHHAAAVLVMGPVAATVAAGLHFAPEPFLMAVALGAASDFLTPIGHQNNLLVMGPGGYRFGDYWRLGLPLSCLVAVLGTLLILHAWPLR